MNDYLKFIMPGAKGKSWDKLRQQHAANQQYYIDSCGIGEKLLVCSHCRKVCKVPMHQKILTCIANNLGNVYHPGEISMN